MISLIRPNALCCIPCLLFSCFSLLCPHVQCALRLVFNLCECVCLSPADEAYRNSRQLCGGNHAATEKMIQFGRELQALNEQLCREYGKNTTHKKMLQVYTHTHMHTCLSSTNSCATADYSEKQT